MTAPPHVRALDHLVLTVADIPASLRFYQEVLGMRATRFVGADGTERHALVFGSTKINLHQVGAEFEPKARRALPGTADLCLLSDAAPDLWRARLNAIGVAIEDGPVPRTGATGPLVSIYLRDPDGNLIEIGTPGQSD